VKGGYFFDTGLGEHWLEEKDAPRYTARLLIGCADRPGIVAAVSGFLFERGANIVSSHQYSSDPSGGSFFLRTEFFLPESSDAEIQSADTHAGAGGRERLQCRAARVGALHADPQRRLPTALGDAGDQHPPLVPAGVRGGRSLIGGRGSGASS
jgi:hypothetical protein